MRKKLVIFGAGDIAQLAHFYFTEEGKYQVEGFVVDDEYKQSDQFCELPLVRFSQLESQFPASDYDAFVAVSYNNMNELRAQKYMQLKEMGYSIASYISPYCTNFAKSIGENCFILEDNTLQPFVTIGNNCTLWSGNHIGHHSTIGDHNFLTSHVVVSGGVNIGNKCFIGVNATLRDHIKVADKTLVAAGALLLNDTEENGVYKGAGKATKASVPADKAGL